MRDMAWHRAGAHRSYAAAKAVGTLLHSRWRGRPCRAAYSSHNDVQQLLDRTQWLLRDPSVEVTTIQHGTASFAIVRDDLLHPFLGGNKFRKLDGLWAQLAPASDVVTCGGLQSAHTAAVAAACAQHGKHCHLLVRGERPAVPTGHHLYARLFAHHVEYASRSDYANREGMLAAYVHRLHGQQQQLEQQQLAGLPAAALATGVQLDSSSGSSSSSSRVGSTASRKHVAIVPEGATSPGALLGLIRLAAWLAAHSLLAGRRCNIVVDSGTGATATGLALGAALLGLPWQVTGVILAAVPDYYLQQQRDLTAAFCEAHGMPAATTQQGAVERLRWVPRLVPRRFGKVLAGEVAACQAVAQQHGIVLDPMWNLAAWEVCCQLATAGDVVVSPTHGGANASSVGSQQQQQQQQGEELVVMLHTGGMLGLCGLAQRFPDQF